VLCALVLCGTGCETDPASGFQINCLELVNNDIPATGEVSLVWGADSTCDLLELEVYVTDVEDIWSVSFTLDYPDALVQYAGVSFGDSLLREDGNDVLPPVVDPQFEGGQASLVVGFTRTNSDVNAGIDAATSTPEQPDASLLLRLLFVRAATAGEGPLEFRNAVIEQVANPGELPVDADPPIDFNGDAFRIN
jgi:hypothetical protein